MTDEAAPGLEVSLDRRRLILSWPDGRVTAAPAHWLFDNAEDGFDPVSGHRLRGALGLASAETVASARLDGATVCVTFSPGGEERRVLLSALSPEAPARQEDEPELWSTPETVAGTPPVAFEAYLSDDGALAEALGRIVRQGLVFLSGAGTSPQTVERAVARFGHIRETNYGRLFDVREEAVPSHLAYTATALELHTDNPYRDPPPALQALHVIEAAGDGGESQFVDGFAHAAALRAAAAARFDVLASTSVEFAYLGPSGEHYRARAPIVEMDGSHVTAVRVNHRSLRPLPLTLTVVEDWYEAYLDFYRRIHAPTARLERKLAPGEMVIFDNRRVLHGRSAYDGQGRRRWLQGCYAERDGLLASFSRLCRDRP